MNLPNSSLGIGVGLILAAGFAAALGYYAIAGVVFFACVGVFAIGTMKSSGTVRANDPLEGLDPESRALFMKFRKYRAEIARLSEQIPRGSATSLLVAEGERAADRILEQVSFLLRTRRQLKRATSGRSMIGRETEAMEAKLASAQSDGEREALQAAIAAKGSEQSHYAEADENIGRIDADLRRAEAALAEMKARLEVGASTEAAGNLSQDDLREAISRMRGITASVDETQELLENSLDLS